jgi:hypothetical protein
LQLDICESVLGLPRSYPPSERQCTTDAKKTCQHGNHHTDWIYYQPAWTRAQQQPSLNAYTHHKYEWAKLDWVKTRCQRRLVPAHPNFCAWRTPKENHTKLRSTHLVFIAAVVELELVVEGINEKRLPLELGTGDVDVNGISVLSTLSSLPELNPEPELETPLVLFRSSASAALANTASIAIACSIAPHKKKYFPIEVISLRTSQTRARAHEP